MMDYPGIPISELNLAWLYEISKLESQLQDMHWIKEVEIVMSIGEYMTSRSIVERDDFPDFDMLDAMIASALKKRRYISERE